MPDVVPAASTMWARPRRARGGPAAAAKHGGGSEVLFMTTPATGAQGNGRIDAEFVRYRADRHPTAADRHVLEEIGPTVRCRGHFTRAALIAIDERRAVHHPQQHGQVRVVDHRHRLVLRRRPSASAARHPRPGCAPGRRRARRPGSRGTAAARSAAPAGCPRCGPGQVAQPGVEGTPGELADVAQLGVRVREPGAELAHGPVVDLSGLL